MAVLHRRRRSEIDARDLQVERDQRHVRHPGIVLPGGADLALGGQEAGLLVVDGELPAAVDRQVEHPVGPAQGLAEFGVAQDGDGHAGARITHLLATTPITADLLDKVNTY